MNPCLSHPQAKSQGTSSPVPRVFEEAREGRRSHWLWTQGEGGMEGAQAGEPTRFSNLIDPPHPKNRIQ